MKKYFRIMLAGALALVMILSLASCEKLEKISFPASLTFIGNKAFEGCEKLNTVIYAKSLEDLTALCSGYENDMILSVKELICQK